MRLQKLQARAAGFHMPLKGWKEGDRLERAWEEDPFRDRRETRTIAQTALGQKVCFQVFLHSLEKKKSNTQEHNGSPWEHPRLNATSCPWGWMGEVSINHYTSRADGLRDPCRTSPGYVFPTVIMTLLGTRLSFPRPRPPAAGFPSIPATSLPTSLILKPDPIVCRALFPSWSVSPWFKCSFETLPNGASLLPWLFLPSLPAAPCDPRLWVHAMTCPRQRKDYVYSHFITLHWN